jgi:hypothetical protein
MGFKRFKPHFGFKPFKKVLVLNDLNRFWLGQQLMGFKWFKPHFGLVNN